MNIRSDIIYTLDGYERVESVTLSRKVTHQGAARVLRLKLRDRLDEATLAKLCVVRVETAVVS